MNLKSENCMSDISLIRPLLDMGEVEGFSCSEPLSVCTLVTSYQLCLSISLVTTFFIPLGCQSYIHFLLRILEGSPILMKLLLSSVCAASPPRRSLYHFLKDPFSSIVWLKDLCTRHCHSKSPKVMTEVWLHISQDIKLDLPPPLPPHLSLGSPSVCSPQPQQLSLCPEPTMIFHWLVKYFPVLEPHCWRTWAPRH